MPASRRSRDKPLALDARGARQRPARPSRCAPGRLTSFTGRDAELATLSEHWEASAPRRGRSVLVLGEAGIARVARSSYRECLIMHGHAWVEDRSHAVHDGHALHPMIATTPH